MNRRHLLSVIAILFTPICWACCPSFPITILDSPSTITKGSLTSTQEQLGLIELDLDLPGKLDITEILTTLPKADYYRNPNPRTKSFVTREIDELKQITGWQENHEALLDYKKIRELMVEKIENDDSISKRVTKRQWPNQLPQEFKLYLNAAADFGDKKYPLARRELEQLLALPADDRKHRSIWAHFLLARIALKEGDESMERSLPHFQQVIQLHAEGYSDSLSMRWDALEALADHEKLQPNPDQPKIIKYYFALTRVGHYKAMEQLCAVTDSYDAVKAAKDPVVRQIVTSLGLNSDSGLVYWGKTPNNSWLDALETANVNDREANRLAAAAYSRGQYDYAERWLNRASTRDEIGNWVASRLAIQSGDVSAALNHLDLVKPAYKRSRLDQPPYQYDYDNRYTTYSNEEIRAELVSQYWAELGVTRLANNQFTPALDALIRSGYWRDAAFIAEQLISVEELLTYVREHYPKDSPNFATKDIRYLTGRRLAREQYFKDAKEFLPETVQDKFAEYVENYRKFRDPNHSDEDRFTYGWKAANIHRSQGMKLFGTEVGPDWYYLRGSYQLTSYSKSRYGFPEDARVAENNPNQYRNPAIKPLPQWDPYDKKESSHVFAANDSEIWRFQNYGRLHNINRYHYRYVAADLAWEASLLLPDNSTETAETLNTAGKWIAIGNPKVADTFYKSLVNRNREISLGIEADVNRWFVYPGQRKTAKVQ